jgi:hypothetical protein
VAIIALQQQETGIDGQHDKMPLNIEVLTVKQIIDH